MVSFAGAGRKLLQVASTVQATQREIAALRSQLLLAEANARRERRMWELPATSYRITYPFRTILTEIRPCCSIGYTTVTCMVLRDKSKASETIVTENRPCWSISEFFHI